MFITYNCASEIYAPSLLQPCSSRNNRSASVIGGSYTLQHISANDSFTAEPIRHNKVRDAICRPHSVA